VSGTKVLFADDITLAVTGPDLQVIEKTLNKDLAQVAKWAKKKKLSISASKLQITLFTPNNRELNVKPQIFFQGSQIPVENLMKILGLTIDSLHKYTAQEKNAASSGQSGHRVIKAAQGTDWGLSKKDGLMAYKALVETRLGYAGPLWIPVRNSLKHLCEYRRWQHL
jgi:hypothetical protein